MEAKPWQRLRITMTGTCVLHCYREKTAENAFQFEKQQLTTYQQQLSIYVIITQHELLRRAITSEFPLSPTEHALV